MKTTGGLKRRTPLRAQPRAKGNRGERAIVDMVQAYGWRDARRNWQSGGQGGGDIINGPVDVHLEVKHRETCKIWAWIRQAEAEARPTDIPVVVLRDNKHPWWCVLPADEWDALWQLMFPRPCVELVRHTNRASLWAWIDQAVTNAPFAGHDVLPSVRFSRPGCPNAIYTAVPFVELLSALRIREAA